jgi:hypothetical protein
MFVHRDVRGHLLYADDRVKILRHTMYKGAFGRITGIYDRAIHVLCLVKLDGYETSHGGRGRHALVRLNHIEISASTLLARRARRRT